MSSILDGKAAIRQQLLKSCELTEQQKKFASLLGIKSVPVSELVDPKNAANLGYFYALKFKMITHSPLAELREGNVSQRVWFQEHLAKSRRGVATPYGGVQKLANLTYGTTSGCMTQNDHEDRQRRSSMTQQERRDRFQETHDTAMATIASEVEARRKKTESLRAAREAKAISSSG